MKKTYTENWTKDVKFSLDYTDHLHSEMSDFQQIDFYKSETMGVFFTLDGLMMVSEKDEFHYHDMITHVSLAVNPNIKKVLIIGGGDGGTAREVSRYKHIETIDMVEIDERVVRLCQTYLPQTASTLDTDERIHLFFQDGLKFVEQAKDKSYDLILVDSTDPIGPGEGLFSKEFYSDCFRVLTDEGILINQHETAFFENYKKEMKRAHSKIKGLFPISKVYQFNQAIYPSGSWLFGFASKKYDPIFDHKPELWEQFNIKTKYYNSNLHKASFCLPSFIQEALEDE